jgi:membrane protease YdiL (CAAX protease family)
VNSATSSFKTVGQNHHNLILWILVGGLFFLRIPFYTGVSVISPPATVWAIPVYEVGTYLLTAIAIWWERERLSDYHIDKLALGIIIFGAPLELLFYQTHILYDYPSMSRAYWLYLPISLVLGISLLVGQTGLPRSQKKSWLWLMIAILTGIILGVFVGILMRNNWPDITKYKPLTQVFSLPAKVLIFLPMHQMFFAGIAEEPFFRGFLWGLLRKVGLKEIWIWLIQAGLFWLGHLYYLGKRPWSFWLVIPGGLVLGWLAWRSRSIANSMIAHGLENGFGQMACFYMMM